MANTYTSVALADLPAQDVVEALDYETILSEMLADLIARAPTFTALVESDPAYKVLEVAAYREMLLRQRINDAARAVMLATGTGADLDNIAARYDVARMLITPADDSTIPPTPAVYETDDELRTRVLLSIEAYTTAGSAGAYTFHALSASGDCKDVAVPRETETPGVVRVAVLSRTGTGAAPAETLAAVTNALGAETVRPLCDTVQVESAQIVNYSISATLKFLPGVAQSEALAAARAAAEYFAADAHMLGRNVARSGIFAALHQPGVSSVTLTAPAADLVIAWNRAPNCTAINLTNGGTDE